VDNGSVSQQCRWVCQTPTICNWDGWNPHCFQNVRSFPTKYVTNRKAWVIQAHLTDYWRASDTKMCLRNRNIAHFMGQCAAHPQDTSYLNNVKDVFCPITATAFSNHLIMENWRHNKHVIQTLPQAICKNNYFYDGTQGVSWWNTHAGKLLQKQYI
jgi:hypothetical protein